MTAHICRYVGFAAPLATLLAMGPACPETQSPAPEAAVSIDLQPTSAEQPVLKGMPCAAGPARHAAEGTRLNELMRRIAAPDTRVWPQEIAADRAAEAREEQDRLYDQIEAVAGALADAARQIPDALPTTPLPGGDREQFVSYARQLETQSRQLQSYAAQRRQTQMRQAIQQISCTCNACHQAFRDVPRPVASE